MDKSKIKFVASGVLLTIAVVTLLLVLSGCAKKELTDQEWSSISDYIGQNEPPKPRAKPVE
jgi:uncharacterized membrane protein